MSGMEWYARNSDAALEGMRRLTLEQRGAYNTILDLIYRRGGPIPDDDRWLAGWMNCSVRTWRRLRGELLAAGRIVLRGENLSDEKAEATLAEAMERTRERAESGRKGGLTTSLRTILQSELDDQNSENQPLSPSRGRAEPKRLTIIERDIDKPQPSSKATAREASGRDGKVDAQLVVYGRAILDACPEPCRGDYNPHLIGGALRTMRERGHDPLAVTRAIIAYYQHSDQQREGGRYAKRLKNVLFNPEVWSAYSGSTAPILGVVADNTTPQTVEWEGRTWTVPPGKCPTATHDTGLQNPSIGRQWMWIRNWYEEGPHSWRWERGSPPGEDGCRIWPEVQEYWRQKYANRSAG